MSKEAYEARAKVFYEGYYGQLEGAVIQKFIGFKDEEGEITSNNEGFPTFQVKYPNGEIQEIQVSQDEEGNGGGHLFLPFEPVMEEYDKAHKLNEYAKK